MHFCEALNAAKFIQTEGTTVVARGRGRSVGESTGNNCTTGTESGFYKGKRAAEVGGGMAAPQRGRRGYHCLAHFEGGEDGRFYVACILQQQRNKNNIHPSP